MKEYIKQKKKRNDETARMTQSLEVLQKKGAKIYVDGEMRSPRDTAAMVVCEEQHYMADYIFGKTGKVEQVRFDWINP